MAARESIRPGGRSARVQASVHQAVRELMAEVARSEVTVPLIAARAGVTPSTIYRRWGDLQELLADVAVARLRPEAAPDDTGTTLGDLVAWAEQWGEEMASAPGRAMTRDVLSTDCDPSRAGQCYGFVRDQLQAIADRAGRRGEPALDLDAIVDLVVAPILYRIHFSPEPPDAAYCRRLVERAWRELRG